MIKGRFAIADFLIVHTFFCSSFGQVIELPIKHPELFESLGIAQPKVFEIVIVVVCVEVAFPLECINEGLCFKLA